MSIFLKDDKLACIHKKMLGNIAQYISLSPDGQIRYIKINNFNRDGETLEELIETLITSAHSKAVNIRSFSPTAMKGNALIYNKTIDDISEIIHHIQHNCSEGKYSIVNENININDGGVSGVVLGNIIEFSPNDTPKCVEKEGVCLLDKKMGYHMIETVYGFLPEFNFPDNYRVEFSIHPSREGVNRQHTIVWEYEDFNTFAQSFKISWPNNFSKFIGDKAFGLIVADYLGFNVPFTTVIARNVAPFTFGKKTGLYEKWIRTSPIVKESGKYYTGDKWVDPFLLMETEEKKGTTINIASILSQDAVEPIYSGGAIVSENKKYDIIEGVMGKGDDFMLGNQYQKELPEEVLLSLHNTMDELRKYNYIIGEISIEWVYDGIQVWILQLNQLKNKGAENVIVPGEPKIYEQFFVYDGLEKLRIRIKDIENKNIGIELVGKVGICSHFGDILRQFNIPSRIVPQNSASQ